MNITDWLIIVVVLMIVGGRAMPVLAFLSILFMTVMMVTK
jgi:hypothetical protein